MQGRVQVRPRRRSHPEEGSERRRLGSRAAQMLRTDRGGCHGLAEEEQEDLRDSLQLHQQVPGKWKEIISKKLLLLFEFN